MQRSYNVAKPAPKGRTTFLRKHYQAAPGSGGDRQFKDKGTTQCPWPNITLSTLGFLPTASLFLSLEPLKSVKSKV